MGMTDSLKVLKLRYTDQRQKEMTGEHFIQRWTTRLRQEEPVFIIRLRRM